MRTLLTRWIITIFVQMRKRAREDLRNGREWFWEFVGIDCLHPAAVEIKALMDTVPCWALGDQKLPFRLTGQRLPQAKHGSDSHRANAGIDGIRVEILKILHCHMPSLDVF
jgi:hypothetical protein